MRLELAGTLVRPDPVVFRFEIADTFYPAVYMAADYTHFEVICIGAGGGPGGGLNTGALRSYGGAGGGGGYHRVRGLLSALGPACPIVIGAGGALGNEHGSDPAQTTNGGDGGYSSFNTNTCRASGGKGGIRVQTNSLGSSTLANGGEGGWGNRITAGGGALGGIAGSPGTAGTDGANGNFVNNIGRGGGGGAGGLSQNGVHSPVIFATAGGRGSYNPSDMSAYGPGDTAGTDPVTGSPFMIPGGAGGAKASPLSGLPTVYGQSYGERLPGNKGLVVIRLTAE